MPVTSSTIKSLFPEFSSLDNGYIEQYVSIAESVISNEASYGSMLDSAVSFYTAHLLASIGDGSGNNSGPVESEKVGDLARSYSSSGLTKDSLFTTKYGIQLWGLKRSSGCRFPQVII